MHIATGNRQSVYLTCTWFRNAAVRLLTGAMKRPRLPFTGRYSLFTSDNLFALKALPGLAPAYLSELHIPFSTAGPLRSAEQSLLFIPVKIQR